MTLPALWPSSLPLYPDVRSVSGQPEDQVHQFRPEQGLGIRRPHQTAVTMQYQVAFAGLTEDQLADFWTFRDETLTLGALAFGWLHPRKRVLREISFASVPRETQTGRGRWNLSFEVEFIDVSPSWNDEATFANGYIVAV